MENRKKKDSIKQLFMRSAIQAQIYAQTACIWEATARKIGNVHARKHFETTEYTDFLISAGLLGIAFDQKNSVGRNVLNTIALTSANVRQNTNLGIALMIAPLFACNRVESTSQESTSPELTSEEVEKVLNLLNEQDAKDVYEAIRLAKPGGLGKVDEGDVSQQPTVNLLEAMSLAAERDQIAFEYTHCFHKTLAFRTIVSEKPEN